MSIQVANIGNFAQWDADAARFLDVINITENVKAHAINDLVKTLKSDGVYDKFYSIWPMIGGTATTHKYNLINPLDTNAAFRLVWNGGWTHSSAGALPNGSTGYASTFLIPNNVFNSTDGVSVGYESNTSTGDADEYVFAVSILGAKAVALIARRTTNTGFGFCDISGGSYRYASGSVTNAQALFSLTQNGTDIKLFRDSTTVATNTAAGSNTFATIEMVLGAINNNGTKGQWTNKQCQFAFAGEYLSVSQQGRVSGAITAYQATLSR